MIHPLDLTLRRLHAGLLDRAREVALTEHLAECRDCRVQMRKIRLGAADMPCCDYRDHTGGCACPNHPRTLLHPFGVG